jgi:hypothetical protein
VKLHWHGSDDVLTVDDEVMNPVASFTMDGRLVVVGDHWGRVYDLDRSGVTAFMPFEWAGVAPVAEMAATVAAEFATLGQDGTVQVWIIA